jgi:hypothetical protein
MDMGEIVFFCIMATQFLSPHTTILYGFVYPSRNNLLCYFVLMVLRFELRTFQFARQALYCLSHAFSTFSFTYFWNVFLCLCPEPT